MVKKVALQRRQHIPQGSETALPFVVRLTSLMAIILQGDHDIRRGALAFDDAAQAARSNARDPLQTERMVQR